MTVHHSTAMRFIAALLALAVFLACSPDASREVGASDSKLEGRGSNSSRGEGQVGRVVVLAIDGATWRMMNPLISDGEMPNLASVLERGCRGTLRSLKQSRSPIIWTSVATGVAPAIHGIDGFVRLVDGKRHLYTSDMVKSPTLWEIASTSGITVGLTNYWFTYPVREVSGFMVSDHILPWRSKRIQKKFAHDKSPEPLEDGLVHPAGLEKHIDPMIINASLEPIPSGISAAELAFRRRDLMRDENELIWRIADEAVKHHPVRLEIRYLKGIDGISHFFWGYWEPDASVFQNRPLDEAKVAQYGQFVPELYRHFDGLLGELTTTLTDDDVLVILSDHGFEARILSEDNHHRTGRHGGPSSTHGIYVFAGGPIVNRDCPNSISLRDVTPTILHLLGLEVPYRMQGSTESSGDRWGGSHGGVAIKLISPGWLAANPVQYRREDYPRVPLAGPAVDIVPDEEWRVEQLRELGYLK